MPLLPRPQKGPALAYPTKPEAHFVPGITANGRSGVSPPTGKLRTSGFDLRDRNLQQPLREVAIGRRGRSDGYGARPAHAGAGRRGAAAQRTARRSRAPPGEELRDPRHPMDPPLRRSALCPAAQRARRRAGGPEPAKSAARADPVEMLPAARAAEEVEPDARIRARRRSQQREPLRDAADLGGRPRDQPLPARPRRPPPPPPAR